MSEKIVKVLRRQVCDLCHGRIEEGERCRLVRYDFWPMMVWFEHIHCPSQSPSAGKTRPRPRPAATAFV